MDVSGRREDVKDLSASLLQSSDDGDNLVCLPCKQYGSYAIAFGYCQNCAEHLCETCYKSHKKPAPCRNHVLLDKAQMPKSPTQYTTASDLTETCNTHHGQVIEYFCKDHKVIGCSPCITMNHRTCKINYIPDISRNYITSPEYQNFMQSFSRLNERMNKIAHSARANKEIIENNRSKVKADILKFRQEIDATLDEWEASLLTDVDNIFSREEQSAESTLAKCVETTSMIEVKEKHLRNLERDDKCSLIFICAKQYDELINREVKAAEELERENEVSAYTFEPNVAVKNLLLKETSLGTLYKMRAKSSPQKTQEQETDGTDMTTDLSSQEHDVHESELSAKFLERINVKSDDKDSLDSKITGIVVIDTDRRVAIADFPYQCVRIIDVQNKKVVSELKLSSRPWDVELLPGNQLAVTLPNENMIQIFSLSGDSMTVVKTLTIDDSCYEIVFMEGTLVVSVRYGLLKRVTLSGKVVNAIGLHGGYSDNSVAVDPTSGYVYASNGDDIMCFKMSGKVVRKYDHKGFLDPCGLAVLRDGSILVCNEKGRNIYHISADFRNSKIILEEDKSMFPCSIAVDHDRQKLYLGSRFGRSYIKVYQLKL